MNNIQNNSIPIYIELNKVHNGTLVEPCNRIDVLHKPSNIRAWITFGKSHSDLKKYPLENNSYYTLTDVQGQDLYLYTEGVSTEDLHLNLSTVAPNKTNVLVYKGVSTVSLDIEESKSLRRTQFIPNGSGSKHILEPLGKVTIDTSLLEALKLYSTDYVGMELNNNDVNFPIKEDTIHLAEIDTITFHNETTEAQTIKLLYMGVVYNTTDNTNQSEQTTDSTDGNSYVDDDYVDDDYVD